MDRFLHSALFGLAIVFVVSPLESRSQESQLNPQPLRLDQFRPQAKLVVSNNTPDRAKFPVVNVHTHLGLRLHQSRQQLDEYIAMMDRTGVAVCVNLDGKLGDWDDQADFVWKKHKDRIVIFVHIDWMGDGQEDDPASWDCQRPDFARRVAKQLADARQKGASGLKFFKQFGLGYRDADGQLLRIDDRRWDPIWQACGQLGIPVIMHSADPVAFFDPIDERNERYEELSRHPDWSFYGDDFPSHTELLSSRNRVIERHPRTQFIGAHVANFPEDLATVGQWLDRYPNLNIEIASRIGELGRKPYSTREFLIKYADRVMFGTDGPKPEPRMRLYFRFLETKDEYFPYSEQAFPPQGFWNIYGVGLPDPVLKKIYFQNACRIIPGVQERIDEFERNQQP